MSFRFRLFLASFVLLGPLLRSGGRRGHQSLVSGAARLCGWLRVPEVLEVLFVGVGLVGVAAVFWPAALILAGVLGVFACERAAAVRVARSRPVDEGLRRVA